MSLLVKTTLSLVQELEREIDEGRDQAARAEAARALTSSLGRFIQAGWHVLEKRPFKPNWHIDAISEMVEQAYRRDIHRLMISVPPRHMKSLTTSVFAPAWWWTHDPAERFMTASYGDRLARRDAIKSRDVIRSAWYQRRWGGVFRIKADVDRQDFYANDHGGHRYATTPTGGGTGEGGDVITIDDANKAQDAKRRRSSQDEAAALQVVKEWYGGTLSSRFNDLETGVMIVVGQRIHESDLLGHILETEGLARDGGDWEYLCLPAEYEPNHPFVWPDDPRTEPGELLWPNHIGPEALARLKKPMSPVDQAGQLQQRPAPAEGTILKRAYWRYFDLDAPLAPKLLLQSWDTAYAESDGSDFVVGHLYGIDLPARYLLRETRGRLELPDAMTAIREMRRWADDRFGPHVPHVILVEKTANGAKIIAKLQRELDGVLPVNVGRWGSKIQRAYAVTGIASGGSIFLPGAAAQSLDGPDETLSPVWVKEIIAEWAAFPNAAHDDRVDAFTTAMLWLGENASSFMSRPEPETEHVRRAATRGLAGRRF